MNSVEADLPRPPQRPSEPISPAPSASAIPTTASKPASPAAAPTPDSAPAMAPLKSTPGPDAASIHMEKASGPIAASAPAPAPTASAPVSAPSAYASASLPPISASGSASASPIPRPSATPAPITVHDRAPSPPLRSPSEAASIYPVRPPPVHSVSPPRHLAGTRHGVPEGEGDSELSDPTSTVPSPSGAELNEPEDEIVVVDRANGTRKDARIRDGSNQSDEVMTEVNSEPTSHYPKRKRTSIFNDLSESKIEIPKVAGDDQTSPIGSTKSSKPVRHSLSSVKGVVLGHWRDSPVPEEQNRHAVIGFIDVRDRLRTRIQPINVVGESIANEYPLPPGPGGSWVTFERVVFLPHLVGLDHYQVKEYVRIRSDQWEDTEGERAAAEKQAVAEAVERVRQNPHLENNPNPPLIAYGPELPEGAGTPSRPDSKRRRISGGGFAAINPAPTNGVQPDHPMTQQPLQPIRPAVDPLPGTRPTRILLGHWRGSSEPDPKDRHAVYGILGQNDMFRVKLVRETRDGRFVDGNFPIGAGALWIQYEEVEFEDHLKPLARNEIKEYCRVRQWQLDHGETPGERSANETKAVFEAQVRAGNAYKTVSNPLAPAYTPIAPDHSDMTQQNVRAAPLGGHELRQSRRAESKTVDGRLRHPLPDGGDRSIHRVQSMDALERTNSLARREIARVEAAQGRADRHAANRERAVAAAAEAAAAAAAAIPQPQDGRSRFHESEEMQRLNKVWARQESLRMKAGSEDAKMFNGVKYERKGNGPFMGKLVSQGTIISIDGEDYVEYRVLTKPSFF